MKLSAKEMDDFLSKWDMGKDEGSFISILHPSVWNGYWSIEEKNHFLRWLGRKLHNKYIYSWGLKVEWIDGLKLMTDEIEKMD